MIRSFLLFLTIFLAVTETRADVSRQIEQAQERTLSEHPQWKTLLHYHKNSLGFLRSDADDDRFFLDPKGKTDPNRELEATIRALLEPGTSDTSAQCRFISRFRWLRRELNINPTEFPAPICKDFEEWRALLSPQSVTLVYPASYLNNPASAFGHSFLRIDAAEHSDETRLLAYGASYAAATTETMGALFAFKAIVGLYVGNFSITPFYLQVLKYSDLENRDIWEYTLSLTPEEVERMVEHLWELRGIKFDYYFFDENCASQLLTLLDVARPTLQLADKFSLAVIPLDTIREVLAREGLVTRAKYRPAGNTVLRALMSKVSGQDIQLAASIARGEATIQGAEVTALAEEEHARVLELASEYLRYRTQGRRMESTEEERKRAHELLLARSKLPLVLDPLVITPPAIRPDEAHKTQRITLGVGYEEERSFAEFRFRPAFHEHIDFEPGYPRGAELQFLDTTVRKYEGDVVKLERLSLVEIVSLSPRNALISPISWAAGATAERYRFADGERNLAYSFQAGPGLSYELGDDFLAYGLSRLSAAHSADFDRNYALGVGSELGVLGDLSNSLRIRVRGLATRYVAGSEFTRWVAGAELRYALNTQSALRAGVERLRDFDNYQLRGQVAVDVFF